MQKIEDLMESFQHFKKPLPKGHVAGMPHITPSQWMVLRVIKERSACTVKDLSQSLHMTSSAATQLVDGLVRGGHVIRKRDTSDRRKVVLTLSHKSVAEIQRMKKMMLKHMFNMFKVLNDKEFEQLYRLNKKITDSL